MNGLTILLAEDNDRLAVLMTQVLERGGGIDRIIRFHNGRELLNYFFGFSDEMISGGRYVVLLDIVMPDRSGIEVLKSIKNYDTLKSVPVIMFSSLNDPQIVDLCYHYGCNAFIRKPTEPEKAECLSMLNIISHMQVPAISQDIISKIAAGGVK